MSLLDRMQRAEEHVNLGIAYTSTGMDDEAIAEFEKAVELYWGNKKVHYCLAKAYSDSMRFDLAWKHTRIAERLDFPVERLVNELASISKEPAKVAALPEEEMMREELEVHFARGIMCAKKRDFDEAAAEFRAALKVAPKEGEVHQFLGSVYGEKARSELERGKPKLSGKLFERAWKHLYIAEGLGLDVSEIMGKLGRYAEESGEVKK